MFAEDLSVFFDAAEFGSAATWGALSATVLLDAPTEDVLGGRVQGIAYEATLPTAVFPGIGRGASVSIEAPLLYATTGYAESGFVTGSQAYVVREVRLLDDGRIKRLALASA